MMICEYSYFMHKHPADNEIIKKGPFQADLEDLRNFVKYMNPIIKDGNVYNRVRVVWFMDVIIPDKKEHWNYYWRTDQLEGHWTKIDWDDISRETLYKAVYGI